MKDVIEIFYQPGKVFESLEGRRRAWLLPMILNALLLAVVNFVTPHYLGRENLIRQQMESFHVSPEVMQKALESANNPAAIYRGYFFAVLGACVFMLMVAGILMAFGMMTSHPPRYSTMLSMVCLAFFPFYLVTACMTTLVLITSPDPTNLNVTNLLATNVGAFLDKKSTGNGLYSLMSSMDILSFAEIGLLALGFGKVTKAGFGAGLAAVGGMWALYLCVKVGISLLF